jgi:penicillin-binding protein 1C
VSEPRRGAGTLVLAALLWSAVARAAVPSLEEVRRAHPPSEAELLDRNGELLHELRVDDRTRRLPWVPLDAVSPALVDAVLRAEDRRFWEHAGVDWRALGDATVDTLVRGAPRGASTLSMQVAAMIEPGLQPRGARRSLGQKWDQMRAARSLEGVWSKRQILEAYLNLSTFRGELQGIGAAAQGLFGKTPAGLDAVESSLLAALLRGPNAAPGTVARRACALLPPQACAGVNALAQARLQGAPRLEPRAADAPHLARQLLSTDAPRVITTLDARLQRAVSATLRQRLAELAGRSVSDAAALVLDNATGEVLAYVGNTGEGASARFVDGVRAPRQAGSTLKPFLYGLALEERLLTAAALLDDSPVNLVTPAGLYVPQNYDREFRGLVSVRTALAASLNVPAVRTLTMLGPERLALRLRALGFESVSADGEHYGYSLALGSAEVSLWELANAYRSLANGGLWSRPRLLPAPPARPVRVADGAAAAVVADILSDRAARSTGFGLDNPLASRAWSAVKTGTSKDMRDNWCVGFTARHTVAVWVGNFDGSPMRDVSGVSGAAPAWLDVVNLLPAGRVTAVARPPDVVARRVRFDPSVEPERDELFLAGTEVDVVMVKPSMAAGARITYPVDGAILALDPDIPPPMQRVRFESGAGAEGLAWVLNGTVLEADGAAPTWLPAPGRHELALHDHTGRPLHRVRFEVRP